MKQITVVTEERPGLLAEIAEATAGADVNIETLDCEVVGGTAVCILTVDHYDAAIRALVRAGFNAISEDAILVRLDDRPGALADLTRRFLNASVPLRGVRIVRRSDGKSIVALSTPRTDEAMRLVEDVLVS